MAFAEDHLGHDLPKLGFGLMRLPKKALFNEDITQISQMVDTFLDAGFTYFDTAPLYDVGRSEKAIREALVRRHPRESYLLATKLNAWLMCRNEKTAKKQIHASLERTGAGYFDFYLLHSLMENNYRRYDDYHLWDYMGELKEQGLIRHWGFSYHSGPELLDRLLTEHPETEFVQLQINYRDWDDAGVASQANYEVARKHGKPVIVMEPVKGGKLAHLPAAAERELRAVNPQVSIASWAIRFAASLPGVMTVLSGMSDVGQMNDNLSCMRNFQPLGARERVALQRARTIMGASQAVPCTTCGYCLSGCPQHIAIPDAFTALNLFLEDGDRDAARAAYAATLATGAGAASTCIACGQCEEACPQHIPVINRLTECAEVLE